MNAYNSTLAEKLADRLLDYPETEWDKLIEKWCDGNEDLKQKVHKLASENRNARHFVEKLQNRIYTLTRSSLSDGANVPNEVAGYKVLQKLGTGGSASVYLADKNGSKVALKLLRNGIEESPYARKRFETEHRILATLQHPNIAQLIEGGITDQGIPFVIMEYVDGVPIDVWCDRNQLGIRDRIRLFQTVCHAVHYAHQNLVIHRDIKAEHVLVTQTGDVKLIDFGIAKLMEPDPSGTTVFFTKTGARIMTPEYASPEQVRGDPVTTASDIYSLGVLLYILLTGRMPYTFNTSSMLEIERVVCEQNTVKPSDRIDVRAKSRKPVTSSDWVDRGPNETSGYRGLTPQRLNKILAGDLDRIVLMAMWKEPLRRYYSARAFADDLDNYLNGEPVLARAPTVGYRFRKLITRYKWTAVAVGIAFFALTFGLFGFLWQAKQAQQYAHQAEIQAQLAGQVSDFLINLFESGDPEVAQGTYITIEELLERGVEQALDPGQEAEIQLSLLSVLGRVYSSLGVFEKSNELFDFALTVAGQESPVNLLLLADLQSRMGYNHRVMGNLAMADSLYLSAFQNHKAALGDDHILTIQSMDDWAGIRAYLSRDADLADSLFQEIVNKRRSTLDPFDEKLAESLNNLAYIKMTKGEYHEALRYYEESANIYRVTSGEYHPDRLRTLSGIAVAYLRTGNYGRSEQVLTNLIEQRIHVLGENHPQVAITYYHLAELLKETGRSEQALSMIHQSANIMQNLEAPHQFYPDILFSMATMHDLLGETDIAAEIYHQTAQSCMEIRGTRSPGCIRMYQSIGEFFLKQNAGDEARLYLQLASGENGQHMEAGH